MKLFFGVLVLTCMLFFDEIEASGLFRIKIKDKKRDKEGSSVDHLATSRAHWNSVPTNNQHSLGQRALDLHENLLDNQEYSHQQNSEEPSRPRRKSRKQKDVDLRTMPVEIKAPRKIRDLNKKVYVAKDTITTNKIIQSSFGEGTDIEINSLPVRESVSQDVRRRQQASLAHFHQHYGSIPPTGLAQQLRWPPQGYPASQFFPQPYDNFGVPEQAGYDAAPLLPHSEGHPGGSGTHGAAGLPFDLNVEDQSGGYETQGYPDPSYPPNPYGNYGGHGSGYGGHGSGYGGSGSG